MFIEPEIDAVELKGASTYIATDGTKKSWKLPPTSPFLDNHHTHSNVGISSVYSIRATAVPSIALSACPNQTLTQGSCVVAHESGFVGAGGGQERITVAENGSLV